MTTVRLVFYSKQRINACLPNIVAWLYFGFGVDLRPCSRLTKQN